VGNVNDSPNIPKNPPSSVAKSHPNELRQETSRDDNTVEVQSIVTGDGGLVTNNQQSVTLNLADREFYFDMEVRTENNEKLLSNILRSGCLYLVRVSVNRGNKYNGTLRLNQNEVIIERELSLKLEANEAFLLIEPKTEFLNVKCRKDWHCTFSLITRDRQLGKLSLLYQEKGSYNLERTASTLEVEIDTVKTSQPELSALTANVALTDNAIALYIIPNGSDNKWTVNGISLNLPPFSKTITPPSDSNFETLEKYAESGTGSNGLLTWLREVFKTLPQDCCIAIYDYTQQQIVWEALPVDTNEYIGLKARVVRWTELKSYEKQFPLDLSQSFKYQSRLVAFVHPSDAFDFPNFHKSIDEWRKDVTKKINEESASVLLMHCKGHFYCDREEITWTWEPLIISRTPTPIPFSEIKKRVQNRPFFLFVNAPYSARLRWYDSALEDPKGIVVNALTKIASGYMGVLVEVPTGLAIWVQNRFLNEANSEEGVRPAQFLQETRQLLLDISLNDKDPKRAKIAELGLPYAFAYTYYGNPNDVVKITGGTNP